MAADRSVRHIVAMLRECPDRLRWCCNNGRRVERQDMDMELNQRMEVVMEPAGKTNRFKVFTFVLCHPCVWEIAIKKNKEGGSTLIVALVDMQHHRSEVDSWQRN